MALPGPRLLALTEQVAAAASAESNAAYTPYYDGRLILKCCGYPETPILQLRCPRHEVAAVHVGRPPDLTRDLITPLDVNSVPPHHLCVAHESWS